MKRPHRRTGHRRPVKGKARCGTGKARYRSFGDASSTAKYRAERAGHDLFVYECPHCRGWHITHLSAKAYDEARKGRWATGSGE